MLPKSQQAPDSQPKLVIMRPGEGVVLHEGLEHAAGLNKWRENKTLGVAGRKMTRAAVFTSATTSDQSRALEGVNVELSPSLSS